MSPTQSAQLSHHIYPDGLALGLLVLGFGLRVYHLGYQSLWYDEGFSVYLATQSLPTVTTGDLVPPLYHYLLHLWLPVAGRSEFAVRFLSLVFGMLLLPLAYSFAVRYFDRTTGRIAILVTALSFFHVSFSQEARMYTLVTFLGLLSAYSLFRALDAEKLETGGRRWWLVYGGATAAALYTHYYAFLLLPAQGAYVLWRASRCRSHRSLRTWIASLAGLASLYLPWTPILLDHFRQQNASYWPSVLSLEFVASRTLFAFTTGQLLEGQLAQAAELGYTLLVLAGIVSNIKYQISNLKSQIQAPVLFLLFYLLVPFALTYFIVHDRAKFSTRYLLVIWPAFALLAARGLRACLPMRDKVTQLDPRTLSPCHLVTLPPLRVGLATLALVFVLASSAQAANNLYRNPRYGKDDYRALAAYLTAHVRRDEVILLLSGHIFPVFSYYYHGDNWYPIPAHAAPSPTISEPLTFDIAGELNTITDGRSGVWVVLWQDDVVDPNGVLTTLLDWGYDARPVNAQFRGLGLRHYAIPPGARLPDPLPWQAAPELSVVGEVALRGFILLLDSVRPGDQIEVLLNWQALVQPSAIYKLSLRLKDTDGNTVAAADSRLAGFWYASDRWKPGETVAARHRLQVPKGTAPGQYRLDLIAYRETDLSEVGSVTLTPITIK